MKIVSFVLCLALTSLLLFTASCSSSGPTVNNANANLNSNIIAGSTPEAGSAETKATPPENLVVELYKQHDAKRSPFFQTKDRALVDKYFTKPLADLIWKDATESKNEVGAIEADPLYNAQDTEIKNFAVGKGDIKDETAAVAVTFTNFGEKQTISYSLKLINGTWKIDNIGYGGGDSLMKWLKEAYSKRPESPSTSISSGEFEGKYQVGETTCTVKPVKMAFEVRWAKGSGVEMFAFTEDNTFESAPGSNDSNAFVFADGNYNTGTFYRADGKQFPVKRAR